MKVVYNQFVLELSSDDLHKIGLMEKENKDIKKGLKGTNKYIKENGLEIHSDLSIKDPNQPVSVMAGVNKTVFTWYGWDVYMDDYTTTEVIHKIQWGQTALLIGGFIASMVPGAGATVATVTILGEIVLSIGSTALTDANHGNGVVVSIYQPTHGALTTSQVPFWVSSQ